MSEHLPLARRIEASAPLPRRHERLPLRSVLAWTRWGLGLAIAVLGTVWLLQPQGIRSESAPERLLASNAPPSAGGGGCGTQTVREHSLEGTLSFLIVCLVACCALEHSNLLVPHWLRFPLSVVLFLAGMVAGVTFLRLAEDGWGHGLDDFFEGMEGASYLNAHAIFYILLPPLLYESASSMSWRVFRKVLRSSVLLALPGVVLNTMLTGCFVKAVFLVGGVEAASWPASLLLASILSATDPVAVVVALHELGAPRKLATLIEGESLLNDGSAVVFFFVFLDMVATDAPDSTKQCAGMPPPGGCVVLYFLRLALGGPALGLAIGLGLFVWIGKASMRHAPTLEIGILLSGVYATFFLAESIHVSGVLAVVTLGVFVSAAVHTRLSHEGQHAHHVVLAQIGYFCNQVIFFAAGIISARFMWTDDGCHALYRSGRAWGELASLYFCIHATRGVVLLVFSPMLVRLGYGITWKEGVVLVWGGLRGAVGLAMGLIVEHHGYVDRNVSEMVAFHVSGIVLLTLLINGSTVDSIYRRLDPYPANAFRMTYVRNVLTMVEEECRKEIVDRLCGDWFFQTVDFATIVRCIPRFSHIEFNGAGVPNPEAVEAVSSTLETLEDDGTKFTRDLGFKMMALTPPRPRRSSSWDLLKAENSTQFIDSLQKSALLRPHMKDTMHNVVSNGDQRLDFRAAGGADNVGLYVSAKPLSSVHAMRKDTAFFNVSIVTLRGTAPVVGLFGSDVPLGEIDGRERDPIGVREGSVGLDCGNGIVRYNGPNGSGEVQLAQTVSEGESIIVVVSQNPDSKLWEVTFALEIYGTRKMLQRIQLGLSPDELYPAIQFMPCIQKQFRRQGSITSQCSGASKRSRRTSPDLAKPANRGRMFRVSSMSSWASGMSNSQRAFARVTLSFELLSASMRESMIQLFHVMFNMVSHSYRNMKEHGLIGNEALSWLSESVAAAVECTDGELNHVRAEDFRRFAVIKAHLSDKTAKRTSEVLRRTMSDDPYLMVFEPAIVEYLVLEESVSADSWLDAFPAWTFIRRYGYGRTQTKVESLWAFVEAHTKVINECPALKRYPHLLDSLSAIVEEAKRDLGILEDINCRRFFYSRHFLALRVMLTKKLQKLKAATQQGWLSAEDCLGLEASLWDRLHQVERFVPGVRRRRNPSTRPSTWSITRGRSASLDSVMPVECIKQLESGEAADCDSLPFNPPPPASVTSKQLMGMLTSPAPMEDTAWRQTFERLIYRSEKRKSVQLSHVSAQSSAASCSSAESNCDPLEAAVTAFASLSVPLGTTPLPLQSLSAPSNEDESQPPTHEESPIHRNQTEPPSNDAKAARAWEGASRSLTQPGGKRRISLEIPQT